MRNNKFYKDLKGYLTQYHPELAEDENFILERTELAQQTFIDSSRNGDNIESSIEEANTVLYQGLHFSSFLLVKDIIEEEFNSKLAEDKKFVNETYFSLLPIIKEYNPGDDFERTSGYDELYNRIIGIIQENLESNGIQ